MAPLPSFPFPPKLLTASTPPHAESPCLLDRPTLARFPDAMVACSPQPVSDDLVDCSEDSK